MAVFLLHCFPLLKWTARTLLDVDPHETGCGTGFDSMKGRSDLCVVHERFHACTHTDTVADVWIVVSWDASKMHRERLLCSAETRYLNEYNRASSISAVTRARVGPRCVERRSSTSQKSVEAPLAGENASYKRIDLEFRVSLTGDCTIRCH